MSGSASDVGRSPFPESLLAQALATVSEGSLITDAAGRIVYANAKFTAITGYNEREVLGSDCRFLQGNGTDAETVSAIRLALASAEPFQGTVQNYRKNGEAFWNALTITPLKNGSGAVTHFVSVQRDVSLQVAQQQQTLDLLEETRRQRETDHMLLDAARLLGQGSSVPAIAQIVADVALKFCGTDRAAVALWDSEAGRITVEGLSGWDDELAARLREFHPTPYESPELAEMIASNVAVLVNQGGSVWAKATLDQFGVQAFAAVPISAGGELRGLVLALWVSTSPPDQLGETLHDWMSGLAGLAAVALDNTRLIEEARWNGLHDALTGLPNRAFFEDSVIFALEKAHGEESSSAVISCDIDRFQRVNDVLGHGAGNAVLRHVAGKLKSVVRVGDVVARLGGDEFVILLPNVTGSEEASSFAEQVQASLTDPLDIGGRKVFVNVSLGIALSDAERPPYVSSREAAEQLINAADAAMYRAKARARGNVSASPAVDELRLDSDLHGAVERREIVAFYQPQIDLETGRIVAVEALARWRHPHLGFVPPSAFIPIAEENGLIHEIGEFILAEACRLAARWHKKGASLEVAVNVSSAQLASPGIFRLLGVGPGKMLPVAGALTLEITESQIVVDTPFIATQLERLQALGIAISIDDFGTGHSSLSQLHNLPVDEFKIDQSFVRNDSAPTAALIAAVVSIARGLGLRVVAEGVETEEQLTMVRDLHCDRAQGYLIAKPMPEWDFEKLFLETGTFSR